MSLAFVLVSTCASARDIWADEDGERSASLTAAFKATTLLPEDESALYLLRARLILEGSASRFDYEIAYEHRLRHSPGGVAAFGILPGVADAPFRISQLDSAIGEEDAEMSYRHELDRAFVAFHSERTDVKIGRQAIGLGRGVLFGAVDMLSPFTPLEVDREWRRGVDAIKIDTQLPGSDTWSLGLIAAFGDEAEWDESALIGRLRGYVGDFDAELIFGKRGEDTMFGGTFSAPIGDAEVHGEIAVFDTPEFFEDGGLFGADGNVAKAVVGVSYNFDVGGGLSVITEYHFSGFGCESASDLDPDSPTFDAAYATRFLSRFQRGDMQITGRRALALSLRYNAAGAFLPGLLVMGNPDDGSGVVSPSLTWDASENVTVAMSYFAPFGREPEGDIDQSEYGGSPRSLFLQVSATY